MANKKTDYIPAEIAAAINSLLDNGLTVDEITEQLEISEEVVAAQSVIHNPPTTKRAILELQLGSLVSLLEIAKLNYRKYPGQGASTSITQFTKAAQDIIDDLANMETSEELYRDLLLILQGSVTEQIAALTREARELQIALEKAGLPTGVAKHLTEKMMRSFAVQAKGAYDSSASKIAKLIDYEEAEAGPPGVIPLIGTGSDGK